MSNPKRTVPPHRPDDPTGEHHPAYGKPYGYPDDTDEHHVRMVLKGLAYTLTNDAWEQALERAAERQSVIRKIGRIVHQALMDGMPTHERKALYHRLMGEAGESLCWTCDGPAHEGSCEDDVDMWEPVEEPTEGREAA